MSAHCWHSDPERAPGTPNHRDTEDGSPHRDLVCCFCGAKECRPGQILKDDSHGPYNPDTKIIYRAVVKDDCPGITS